MTAFRVAQVAQDVKRGLLWQGRAQRGQEGALQAGEELQNPRPPELKLRQSVQGLGCPRLGRVRQGRMVKEGAWHQG